MTDKLNSIKDTLKLYHATCRNGIIEILTFHYHQPIVRFKFLSSDRKVVLDLGTDQFFEHFNLIFDTFGEFEFSSHDHTTYDLLTFVVHFTDSYNTLTSKLTNEQKELLTTPVF